MDSVIQVFFTLAEIIGVTLVIQQAILAYTEHEQRKHIKREKQKCHQQKKILKYMNQEKRNS